MPSSWSRVSPSSLLPSVWNTGVCIHINVLPFSFSSLSSCSWVRICVCLCALIHKCLCIQSVYGRVCMCACACVCVLPCACRSLVVGSCSVALHLVHWATNQASLYLWSHLRRRATTYPPAMGPEDHRELYPHRLLFSLLFGCLIVTFVSMFVVCLGFFIWLVPYGLVWSGLVWGQGIMYPELLAWNSLCS